MEREDLKKDHEELSTPEPLKCIDLKDTLTKEVRDLILDLSLVGARECKQGDNIEEKLDDIEEKIRLLEDFWKDNPDFAVLKSMYQDLREDYENGRSMMLDTGFDKILEHMKTESVKMGLRTEVPEKSVIADLVAQLKICGVKPSYVITAGDPKAKTVVYFTQAHSNPGVDTKEKWDSYGITSSQDQIYDGLVNGVNAGIFKHIYAEGVIGQNLNLYDDRNTSHGAVMGDFRAYQVVGDKAEFHGMEDKFLDKLQAMNALVKMRHLLKDKIGFTGTDEDAHIAEEKYDKMLQYRSNAINFFLAWNIASDFLSKDGDVAAMSLGALHEIYSEDTSFVNPPEYGPIVPFSTALALRGLNVIVVDTTEKM